MSAADISVIVPVYNAEDTLSRALTSIANQDVIPSQVIIVNDASTDGSQAIIDSFVQRREGWRTVTRGQNSGTPATPRNDGIHLAESSYVAFLDADDFWLPSKLGIQLSHMLQSSADISATGVRIVRPNGSIRGVYIPPPITTYQSMLRLNSLLLSSVMVDLRRLESLSNKSLRFPVQGHEDYALWLSVLKSGAIAMNVSQELTARVERKGSVSSSPLRNLSYLYGAFRNAADRGRFASSVLTLRYAASAKFRPIEPAPNASIDRLGEW